MTPEECIASYRRMLEVVGETVIVRRYYGTGTNRPKFEATFKARVVGYEARELVGSIQQGDRKIIALTQDLIDAQFALPVLTSDKAVVRGKELAIIAMDDSTRRIGATSIALEIQARG